MSRPFWRLKISSEFSASHALRHYQGKCENIHGHNFSVDIEVQGDQLTQDTEFLVDFSILKRELKLVLEELDHKDLNKTPPFDTINPSSENISRFVCQKLSPKLEQYGVHIYSITVGEKRGQSASYFPIGA